MKLNEVILGRIKKRPEYHLHKSAVQSMREDYPIALSRNAMPTPEKERNGESETMSVSINLERSQEEYANSKSKEVSKHEERRKRICDQIGDGT